jgi:hypothetical protein
MTFEIGNYHVRTVESSSKKFFTVEDSGGDIFIYEQPYGESKKNLRAAIEVAFVDEPRYVGEYKLTGRYPNYRIEVEEVTA